MGCIYFGGRGLLCILRRNVAARSYRKLLEAHLLPYTRQKFQVNLVYQDDNASPHHVRMVQDFVDTNDITRLDWPSKSPNLNPIENVWSHLENMMSQRVPLPENLA